MSTTDYDPGVGEAALVRWGSGACPEQDWIRHNREGRRARYIYAHGHVEHLPGRKTRFDQFPAHRVRSPAPMTT